MLFLMVLFFIGFAVFATGVEREPRETVPTADGITVLTGGADRIDQAMKLLAQGKAKRVLITGVYRATTKEELKQLASQGDQYFACCVDIDKEARNTSTTPPRLQNGWRSSISTRSSSSRRTITCRARSPSLAGRCPT